MALHRACALKPSNAAAPRLAPAGSRRSCSAGTAATRSGAGRCGCFQTWLGPTAWTVHTIQKVCEPPSCSASHGLVAFVAAPRTPPQTQHAVEQRRQEQLVALGGAAAPSYGAAGPASARAAGPAAAASGAGASAGGVGGLRFRLAGDPLAELTRSLLADDAEAARRAAWADADRAEEEAEEEAVARRAAAAAARGRTDLTFGLGDADGNEEEGDEEGLDEFGEWDDEEEGLYEPEDPFLQHMREDGNLPSGMRQAW
jgi:hypothetical protein